MGRRKGVRNKASCGVKGKAPKMDTNDNGVDRNRASPSPVINLCKTGLTKDQRDAVDLMGQASLLNIKCKDLHNPLVSWFGRCYVPSKRAFVVPCRGVIPLSEESVHLMTGLPRGPLEVKYEVDFELEADISNRLFPGQGSRPSVSYVAKRISQYEVADDTFKELWMIHSVCTIFAPTLDNKISNKCYSILPDIGRAQEMNLCKFIADQLHENFSSGKFGKGCLLYCMLRYITAINTDHLALDLENTPYAINSWTTKARDIVAAMDTQEYDSTKFGVMQLRDEFKDVLSRELGLFGGPDGFESWMSLNIHPTSSNEQRKRAYSLMLSFASTLNGALSNIVQGLTESIPCERCEQRDAIKQDESDGDEVDRNDGNNDSGAEADEDKSTSANDAETQTDGDPNANANTDAEPSDHHGKQADDDVVDSPTPPMQAGTSSTPSPPPMHSQINVPSSSDLFGSDGSGQIGGFIGDSQISTSELVDDEIRCVTANLASNLSLLKKHHRGHSKLEIEKHEEIKVVVARELNIPLRIFTQPQESTREFKGSERTEMQVASASHSDIGVGKTVIDKSNNVESDQSVDGASVQYDIGSSVVDLQWPVQHTDATRTATISDAPKYNPLHKRKRQVSSTVSPTRKSPRISQVSVQSNIASQPEGSKETQNQEVKGRRKSSSNLSPSRRSPRISKLSVDKNARSPPPGTTQAAMKQDGQGSGKISFAAEEDDCIARSPDVVEPLASKLKESGKRDGRSATTAVVLSPPISTKHNVNDDRDGGSMRTAFVVSPEVTREPKQSLQIDGRSAQSAFVVSPTVTRDPKESVERDGSSAQTAYVVSPTVTKMVKESGDRDGSCARSAFVLSPAVTGTPKASLAGSKMLEVKDGKRVTSAIPISPTANEPSMEKNTCTDIVISPKTQQTNAQGSGSSESPYRVSPIFGPHLFSIDPIRRSPMSVHQDLARIIQDLSDSANKQGVFTSSTGVKHLSVGGSGSKRKHTDIESSSSSKRRDDRPGMFTPPPFNLFGSSQESSSLDEPIDVVPLSWAPSQDEYEPNDKNSTDDDFEEFKMSDELKDFIIGKTTQVSEECNQELHRYEEYVKAFSARQGVLVEKAKPAPSEGVRSATPKVHPHETRVKKASRFKKSPYDVKFVVNKDHEYLYELILKHKSVRGNVQASNLKSYQLILYKNSWAYTQDLADSIKVRGELSNSCMDVGIEYLQNTNTIKGKMIMTHQLTKYIMDGEFLKPILVSTFKRTETHSLSIMKHIHFPVLHEIAKGQKSGNHWYSLNLNIEAQRFEALDSLRGEGNIGLIAHANGLISKIKELWATYYHDSKVDIQNYNLKIIDVPKQFGNHDCGYHVLFNIENWDGQNIPPIGKHDVEKLRKIFPFNWVNADFNKKKNWRWHLENNI